MKKSLHIILFLICLFYLPGCFTGIESTPRIGKSEVKRQHVTAVPEQTFTAGISSEPLSAWRTGKRFRVTDDRISLIFSPSVASADSLKGYDLTFQSLRPTTSVTGDSLIELIFTASPCKEPLCYRVRPAENVEIPFTVEMSVVAQADSLMRGRTFYALSPMWYDPRGTHTVADGLRHVPIKIDSVVAGNSVFPLLVVFTEPASKQQYSMYMSIGNRQASTRNFHTLMAFSNPRELYPNISAEVWEKIVHSQVMLGMNRDECRLALGSPPVIRQVPTTAGMVEQWLYDDGVYLIFEEGLLSKYRK